MTVNRVEVLCPGMIVRDGPIILEARSTATLVSRGERHLLVDVSGTQNRTVLLDALGSRGISPEQIEIVVLTHLHHDHDGNLELFSQAKKYAHKLESPGPSLQAVSDEIDIWEGVRLIHTPGHTRGCMSVLVRSDETFALVGDAIPSADNVRKGVPPGLNYDADVALASMARLVRMADVIVPGHGPPFRTAEFRKDGR